jgi:hypothetical protein
VSQIVDAIAHQLSEAPHIVLELDASAAFTVASAVQLACRHPSLEETVLRSVLVEVVDQIGAQLGGPVEAAIRQGWDPANDV